MYVIIMFLFVESHQNFAKQMTISTLILFATISVQLKMPRLGTTETQVVQLVNRIPFLDRFCYFEINYLIKSIIYGGIFNAILHISRMIDVNPEIAMKAKILESQRELSKAMVYIELLANSRIVQPPSQEIKAEDQPDPQPVEVQP